MRFFFFRKSPKETEVTGIQFGKIREKILEEI